MPRIGVRGDKFAYIDGEDKDGRLPHTVERREPIEESIDQILCEYPHTRFALLSGRNNSRGQATKAKHHLGRMSIR